MSHKPIGIIDSGLGGLTIWSSIQTLLPNELCFYIADHAWAPYGGKSKNIIHKRVKMLVSYLIEKSCKLVVIACNTATVSGIDQYRQWFPKTPIIGVVPVIKTAAETSKTQQIAVLSTEYTATSDYQKQLIDQFARGSRVVSIGCPELVELIESGQTIGPHVQMVLRDILFKLDPKVDTIVLGCTHFPFLKETIRAIVGDGITLLDSGGAIARQTKRVLEARGETAPKQKGTHVFYTTGDRKYVEKIAIKIMKMPMKFSYANI